MKITITFTIFAIISVIGAVGIVVAMSRFSVAHASQFGFCNQYANAVEHFNGQNRIFIYRQPMENIYICS